MPILDELIAEAIERKRRDEENEKAREAWRQEEHRKNIQDLVFRHLEGAKGFTYKLMEALSLHCVQVGDPFQGSSVGYIEFTVDAEVLRLYQVCNSHKAWVLFPSQETFEFEDEDDFLIKLDLWRAKNRVPRACCVVKEDSK